MKKNIGILDSGIGGVTVLKEIIKILPNENYIYYSDSIHNPYGEKTQNELLGYVDYIIKYFIERNCKAIVIACNTATALTIDLMRKKYKDIIIIGIEPAYKMIYDDHKMGRTLVMATPATIMSERFLKLYHAYDNKNTILKSCSNLATLIENGNSDKIKNYLKKNLIYENIENVVLGCTHYPLIKKEISDILGNVTFYDGSNGVASRLLSLLREKDLINDDSSNLTVEFFDSSNSNSKRIRFYELLK